MSRVEWGCCPHCNAPVMYVEDIGVRTVFDQRARPFDPAVGGWCYDPAEKRWRPSRVIDPTPARSYVRHRGCGIGLRGRVINRINISERHHVG